MERVSVLLPGLWACQTTVSTEPSRKALPSAVSELSLLMEYFRLFSSICNKSREGILSSQSSGEILSSHSLPLFQPHPFSTHPEPAFGNGGLRELRQTEVCPLVSEDCREARRHKPKGDNDPSSPSSHTSPVGVPFREEGEEEVRKILLGPRCQSKAQTITET